MEAGGGKGTEFGIFCRAKGVVKLYETEKRFTIIMKP